MAISVNWLTRVVTVPQTDLVLLAPDCYQLNLGGFHDKLRDLEASATGVLYPPIHKYLNLTIPGAGTHEVIEIINEYTLEFTPEGSYIVKVEGGNSNVAGATNNTIVTIDENNEIAPAGCTPEDFWKGELPMFVDNTVYSNQVLVASRIRFFSTSAQVAAATYGGVGESEIATFMQTATATGAPGETTSFKKWRVS